MNDKKKKKRKNSNVVINSACFFGSYFWSHINEAITHVKELISLTMLWKATNYSRQSDQQRRSFSVEFKHREPHWNGLF